MNNEVGYATDLFSQELRLLLALLEVDDQSEPTFEQWELLQEVDWSLFIELARHHRVFPSINLKLKELKSAHIPSFVLQLFHRDYYRNTLQMLNLCGEMEQLATLFSGSDIQVLFLKGPVIAADLYGDVSLRTSCDLDFLVPMNKLEQVERMLLLQGYEKNDYITSVLNDWKWRHHHITFNHPTKGIKVEVHWRLNPSPSIEPSFEELWDRKRQSSLISRPIYYLGREDLFLFLVSHGARHGWSRLRWLLDIKQLMKQKIDWTKLAVLLRKHHLLHIGGQAISLAAKLLAVPLKEEVRPILTTRKAEWLAEDTMFYVKRMVNLHSPPVPKDVERYHKRYLLALMTSRQKIVFFASMLHPFSEDAETLPLPKNLHFLYFPLRPLLWVWRKTRKIAT
ncbi:nucleotidyltransferase family protein [Paenibacillus sp. GSMTC-2017]|uniref:nucleotidyltransferase domain-containing protein n=1 Tax=Paenibacillus sp. GSMTC-2017 TaxID=2794350 RepID=UPI0018D86320|nr:nucleotidyltransferase family protein [Paenibacillus sp. GSMTC-2017]MBH5317300.1 nucleotidyltransferase family protein [Paenibacillus sp. GSMTC-2017]